MKKRLKINGLIVVFIFLASTFFPSVFLRKDNRTVFIEIWDIVGIALILLGQALRASARGYKSEHSGEGGYLIRGGPYAFVRNPMYLGIFLIGLGIVLVLFKWWAVCILILLFVFRYTPLIFNEEKILMSMFPDQYPVYKKQVPRILPSLGGLLKKDISEYLPLRLPWLTKEIGSMFAVLFITLFLESWEDIKNGGLRMVFKELIAASIMVALFVLLVVYLSRRTGSFRDGIPAKE